MRALCAAACVAWLCGCALWRDPSPTIAAGDDFSITLDELDARVRDSLFEQRTRGKASRVYELRAEVLDAMVEEIVLDAEAARRGIDVDALVAAETAPVTDEQVKAFFEEHRDRLRADATLEDVSDAIREHLSEENADDAVEELIAAAGVEIRLEPPRIDVAALGPALGPENAPVTIIAFSDFQCPYCRRASPVVKEVLRRYPEQVRVVHRYLPLESIHPRARPAAEAAGCAGDQGRFWEYHDAIFANQRALSDADLRTRAEELSLELGTFDACVAERRHRDAVTADVEAAREAGISGTPTFLVNGVIVTGVQSVDVFEGLIDRELRAIAAAP